jgi:hypothetical protein
MSKFVGVLEDLVRENEALRTRIAHLELLTFGPEGEDDEDDADDVCDPDCGCHDEPDDFFDYTDDDDDDDDDLLDMN